MMREHLSCSWARALDVISLKERDIVKFHIKLKWSVRAWHMLIKGPIGLWNSKLPCGINALRLFANDAELLLLILWVLWIVPVVLKKLTDLEMGWTRIDHEILCHTRRWVDEIVATAEEGRRSNAGRKGKGRTDSEATVGRGGERGEISPSPILETHSIFELLNTATFHCQNLMKMNDLHALKGPVFATGWAGPWPMGWAANGSGLGWNF